jgi:hypothetical protein
MKPRFLFSLGSHSKQVGDEGDLSADVSFAHPSDLSLTKHVHHLVSLERSLCRFNEKKAHSWLDQPFDTAMILLDQGIQVFDQDGSSTDSGSTPAALRSVIALG